MFAYCKNNPILKKDSNGKLGVLALCIIGGVAGGIVNYAGQVIKNYKNGKSGSEAWSKVDWGEVASSTFSGAVSSIPGGGFVATLTDVVGSAIIEEGVNYAVASLDNNPNTKAQWNNDELLGNVLNNTFAAATSKVCKMDCEVPRYIRDIKSEAREIGIKGTRRLTKYLNFKQVSSIIKNSFNSDTLNQIFS